MLFFKSKTLSHRQTATIGLVLAVLSMLSMAITTALFPYFGMWLNSHGVVELDLLLLVFFVTIILAMQGLLLFGFPLYYAQDKKSHMTGFQILLYELMWMLVIMFLLSSLFILTHKQRVYSLEEVSPSIEVQGE